MPGLWDTITLRCGLTVRNRVWLSPMSLNLVEDGRPTPRMAAFYGARARGGTGMIVTEPMYVHPTSAARPWATAWDPAIVPGLRQIAEQVHEHGSLVFGQLIHNGRQMTSIRSQRPVWGVSSRKSPLFAEVPHAMTTDEVREVVLSFGQSAAVAQEGGYDGVELHGAHGYLIQQFLLESVNDRQDEYGGSFENRLRFLFEVVDLIRRRCGPGFGIGLQLNGNDGLPDGMTPDFAAQVAGRLAATHPVDYLTVGIGGNIGGDPGIAQSPDMSFPLAPYLEWAEQVRRGAGEIPVGTVGRVKVPTQADDAIRSGRVDYVALGRTLLADSEWADKAREGRERDIRPCISCNHCREFGRVFLPPTCIHNHTIGREAEFGVHALRPAERSRRVAIVGGGPGGLEAALWATRRGHHVTIFEASYVLGGLARLASLPPHRLEFGNLLDFQLSQLERAGVDVRLRTPVEPGDPLLDGFDAVVVAIGSRLRPAALPTDGSLPQVDLETAIRDPAPFGDRVAIVDPGNTGWEIGATAQYLAHLGRQVLAVAAGPTWCSEVPPPDFGRFAQVNRSLGIRQIVRTGSLRIEAGELTGSSAGQSWRSGPLDVVIPYAGRSADDSVAAAFRARHPNVHLVGDCVAPRRAFEAIREGFLTGLRLD